MAFAQVKNSSFGSASTCAFTGGNTLGNFIIVCWLTNGAVATTCNDTQGNVYTRLSTNGSTTNKLVIFKAPITVGGSGTNTVTVSGGGTGFGTFAVEYSGKVSGVDPTSSKPFTGGAGTALNYSIAPAVAGELMFGCMTSSGGGTTWTLTGTAGFNMRLNSSGTFMCCFDNLNCGAGTQAPTATQAGPGAVLTGLMVGIEPAAGVPNSLMLVGCGT